MVAFFIFVLHALGFVYAFVTRKRDGGTSEGILAVAFMGIVFAVGWTIATMLTNLLFTPEFFVKWYYQHTESPFLSALREEFNRDTISLSVLTLGELCFYYILLRGAREKSESEKKGEKEKTPAQNRDKPTLLEGEEK